MRRFKCGNTDLVDVVIGIHAPRHGMSPKKRGGDANRPFAANRARHPQHLEFGLQIKPVARFDFDDSNPFGNKRISALQGLSTKRLLVGLARGRNRRDDAATGA